MPGNQEWKIAPRRPAKEFYIESLGVKEHVSIDINGEWGALPLDLTVELPEDLQNRFDLVTNYGTGEHVEDQYMFFRNVHLVSREGGIIIHELPCAGSWPGHCHIRYTADFIRELGIVCGYSTLHSVHCNKYPGNDWTTMLQIAYKKETPQFPDRTIFQQLPIAYE